jgi:hypothetical protein
MFIQNNKKQDQQGSAAFNESLIEFQSVAAKKQRGNEIRTEG